MIHANIDTLEIQPHTWVQPLGPQDSVAAYDKPILLVYDMPYEIMNKLSSLGYLVLTKVSTVQPDLIVCCTPQSAVKAPCEIPSSWLLDTPWWVWNTQACTNLTLVLNRLGVPAEDQRITIAMLFRPRLEEQVQAAINKPKTLWT
jgi:hypothetical protein